MKKSTLVLSLLLSTIGLYGNVKMNKVFPKQIRIETHQEEVITPKSVDREPKQCRHTRELEAELARYHII